MRFQLRKEGDNVNDARLAPSRAGIYIVELCWDSKHDLDACALMGQNTDGRARVATEKHVLSCYNLNNLIQHPNGSFSTPCGTITHSGDARAATEEEADETITIRCENAPEGINEILVFVTVHQNESAEHKTLCEARKSQVRVRDDHGEDLAVFRLKDFDGNSAIHVVSVQLRPDGWECTIIGEGFRGDLNSILMRLAPNGPSSLAVSHKLAQPSDLGGIEEKQTDVAKVIPVTLENLSTAHPSASTKTLEQACGIVRSVDINLLTSTACITWGKQVQQKYSRLIKRWSSVTQSEALSELREAIGSLQQVLQQIDMSPLRQIDRGGMFDRFTRAKEKARTAALGVFEGKQLEIKRIIELVQGKKRKALEIRDRVTSIKTALRDLENEVQAYIIAGTCIVSYLDDQEETSSHKDLGQLLETRCEALTRTQAEILGSSGVSELGVQQVLEVVRIAEEIILVSVPAWLSNFLTLQVIVEEKRPLADSDINRVADDLSKMSRSLQL